MSNRQVLPKGLRIIGQGMVVMRDRTRYGLERAVVRLDDRYPDVLAWVAMVQPAQVLLYDYRETNTLAKSTACLLFLYWKEARQ